VIRRETQTAAYWRESYEFTDKDAGYVYDMILERAEPVSTSELALLLIEERSRAEEESLRADLSDGRVYQPRETYKTGERLIFPALGFAFGTVTDTRVGSNPDHGEFIVIQVEMDDGGGLREFASALSGDHALNVAEGEGDLLAGEGILSVAELFDAYGDLVEESVVDGLSGNEEFVQYGDEWFLQGLLAPVEAGHLNIAEALIEIKGMPLPTADLLPDLDLPVEIPESIQAITLNQALEQDKRFDNVGDSGRDVWYLRRLVPEPVASPPERLSISNESYDRASLDQELLLVEREIDDEGSGQQVMGQSRQIYRTSIRLIYPHWRNGTIPLTTRTRGLFPQASTDHTPVVLVDGQSGEKMQGWIVHASAFVYGLESWYKRHNLPVGTVIKVERTRDPRVITVDFIPQRLKRLWMRIASVQGGKLVFEMSKVPIACEYDDLLAIGEHDAIAIDGLWTEVRKRGDSLLDIMTSLLPELIKLSPQGTVHAKTVYSAVNMLRRVPPGPVFALLSREPCFVSMGGGYWTFDPELVQSGSQ
jgi:hypothetical protein